jgi:Rad3-related DNA helicase
LQLIILSQEIKVTNSSYHLLAEAMENVISVLGESVRDSALRKLKRALDAVFKLDSTSLQVYRFHIHEDEGLQKRHRNSAPNIIIFIAIEVLALCSNPYPFPASKKFFGGQAKSGRTLSFWCFGSSEAVRFFQRFGVRSLILTSGTLAPLQSLHMVRRLEACSGQLFPCQLRDDS